MIGKTLSRYKIVAKLGEGGMGEVYLAEDTELGREVALKVLPPMSEENPERLERFRREARAVASLNHPNIVTLFNVEEAEGRRLLIMERVEGKSLDRVLPPGGMPLAEVFAYAIPTADALAAAGFGATGVHALSRALDTPEGERLAKFNLVRLPPDEMPEGRVLAIEHLTPEYLWQERYLDHPNGARALTELVVCVEDVQEAARRYARYFGTPITQNGMFAEIRLLEGKISLIDHSGLRNTYGIDPPSLPYVGSVTIAVSALDETRNLLEENGIAITQHHGKLVVSGQDAHGAFVVFEPYAGSL